jgi:pyruvate,orthophosphate dikinase
MTRKLIYRFETNDAEGRVAWRSLLGGKGANLAEMARMGIPVPPGFTITTEACLEYLKLGAMPSGLVEAVRESMTWLEGRTGKQFGGGQRPLLVSVRSGAPISMPGMMDTVLDLGLNDESVRALAQQSNSERFAYDAYRRLLSMFGDVVLGVEHAQFERALGAARLDVARERRLKVPDDPEALARLVPDSALGAAQLKDVVAAHSRLIRERTGQPFPADPYEQLMAAITAVFRSWNTPRARLYRKMQNISDDLGTAVNVQAMVFGNLGETSATGVAFTRDPSTGERRFFGEWLPNAQGEDVVAGIRTPRPLARDAAQPGASLEEAMPSSYAELFRVQSTLEQHFRDMQDLEFTIEDAKLFLLQTRSGKRSAQAAVRIAVEMVSEGLLHPDEAILRVAPERLSELLFPRIDTRAGAVPVARGIPASPGAVTGRAVFQASVAEALSSRGEDVILLRLETSPEDLGGMKVARGILTARGGATSHAAVVARGMGRPCVAGCAALHVDYAAEEATVHGPTGEVIARIAQGDVLTIDGGSGSVYLGSVPTVDAGLGAEMQTLLRWTEQVSRLQVRANADTPAQAQQALSFGAQGVGLCRTEHMFFSDERIAAVREMILSRDTAARKKALAKLLPFQIEDFVGIFQVMRGLPVNIRLLDPPLHEFLPKDPSQMRELAASMGVTLAEVERKTHELFEFNPMLGHRGVRLGISYPEIPAMQVEAILDAACTVHLQGIPVHPEIMVPLAFSGAELVAMRAIIDRVAADVFARRGTRVEFHVGTMIELPRAALLAGELAQQAEFFSFGTNDLTQTTLGLSRDDAGAFLPLYVERGILHDDPFVSLDVSGVGQLVELAVERGKQARSSLKLGVCGEHGGDPKSIDFCEGAGLDYVSCSPFRVPIARVAAAQAALRRRPRH